VTLGGCWPLSQGQLWREMEASSSEAAGTYRVLWKLSSCLGLGWVALPGMSSSACPSTGCGIGHCAEQSPALCRPHGVLHQLPDGRDWGNHFLPQSHLCPGSVHTDLLPPRAEEEAGAWGSGPITQQVGRAESSQTAVPGH
jgi:hypothetical protein